MYPPSHFYPKDVCGVVIIDFKETNVCLYMHNLLILVYLSIFTDIEIETIEGIVLALK